MSLPELGCREQSSFPNVPLTFAQLHPDFKLSRKWRHKIPKDFELKDHLLRFLIKVRNGVEMDALLRAIQRSFGASATSRKKRRIVDDLHLKPLATIPHAESSWWLLELPVLLGPFLSDTRFDLKQLQGLVKQLTAIDFIDGAEADVPYPNLVFPQREKIPGCTVGSANAPQDNFWSQRLIHLLDGNYARLFQEDGQGVKLGIIDTGYTDHASSTLPDPPPTIKVPKVPEVFQ